MILSEEQVSCVDKLADPRMGATGAMGTTDMADYSSMAQSQTVYAVMCSGMRVYSAPSNVTIRTTVSIGGTDSEAENI
jgi:hypothetical protein